MQGQGENMQNHYQPINRKQYTNFKQLLKLKSLKNARRNDQGRLLKAKNILKDSFCNKGQQEGRFSHSYFKLPLETKSFQQINLKQSSQWTFQKTNRPHVFPLIKIQQQPSGCQSTNAPIKKSHNLQNRGGFFQRIRQAGIEKIKESTINRQKINSKYFKSRQSELSLPTKLNCRSISPLTDNGEDSQKKFSIIDQNSYSKPNCPMSSSIQKVSTRYQDIPISQFIYDQNGESGHLFERNMEKKMEKIWRKKSRDLKAPHFHK